MRAKLICVLLVTCSTGAVAQSSDTYQKAAQAYENAAAQCQSPAGASCMRQNASYYSCLARQLQSGGSCSQPSCSTACTSSGSGSGVAGVAGAASGLSQKQQLAITGLGIALTWLSNHHHNDSATPQTAEEEAATADQRAANDAAVQAAIAQADAASSELANMRAALTSGADPSTLGGLSGQGPSDPNVALRNQLTADGDVPAAQPQQVPSNDPSDQMAQLRAQMTAQAAQQDDQSTAALPAVPSIQTLDDEEAAEANAVGPDWASGLANLKDQALNDIGSAINPLDPNSTLHLDRDDYLQQGTQATIQSVLPESNGTDATLGSVVQDKVVGIASDKVADALTDKKDQLSCSGENSQIEQDGCMVFMSPTNIARGLYNYGTILVKRFGTMMTDVNTEMFEQPE